jgi:NAD(P)-dependent dehydrogenase (short-subunit alcohol dehydrogenase family)
MTDRGALVVTGGSRGIGAAIVRQAARQGYAVCFSLRWIRQRPAGCSRNSSSPGSELCQCSVMSLSRRRHTVCLTRPKARSAPSRLL